MAFVNELISDEDKQRFDFSVIRRPPTYLESVYPHHWTIDRERDLFLIWTRGGGEDDRNAAYFALWWKGNVLPVNLEFTEIGTIHDHIKTTWRLRWIGVPPHLERERTAIISALKEALVVYKVGGAGVPVVSHEATFEF